MKLDKHSDADTVVDRSREIAERQWTDVETALDKDQYVPGSEWESYDSSSRSTERAAIPFHGPVGA